MKEAPKVYLARAGRNGEDEDYALEHNIAIISFRKVPSLEGARDYDTVVQLVEDALPDGKPPRPRELCQTTSGLLRLRCRRATSLSCHANSRRRSRSVG